MAEVKELSLKFGSSYGTIKDRLQEQGFTITDVEEREEDGKIIKMI